MGEINWKNKCWVTTVYLVNSEGKVLLTFNKNLNTWIPVGGHIEPGETPEEAVMREVGEETGLEFSFLHEHSIESNGTVRVLKPQRIQIEKVPHHGHHMNVVFYGKCSGVNERDVTDENEKLRWFSKEDLVKEKDSFLENVFKSSIEAIEIVSN